MAREELMIKPRREVAGVVACEGAAGELGWVVPAEERGLVVSARVVACDVAEELGLVVPAGVVAGEAAEELGWVVPARTTALMSPP